MLGISYALTHRMKNIVLIGLVLFGLWGPSRLYAQDESSPVSFYLRGQLPFTSFGLRAFNGDPLLRKHTPGAYKIFVGGAAGVDLWNRVGVEVSAGTVFLGSAVQGNLRGYLNTSDIQPFLFVGGGYFYSSFMEEMKGPSLHGGLGLRWRVSENFYLTNQAYLNLMFAKYDNYDSGEHAGGKLWFPMFEIVGLEFRF